MKSHCRLVAHFSGAEVLDGTGEYIACSHCPFVALGCKAAEGGSVKTHQSFLNNGLHFTVATLHIEHHGDGDTAREPLHAGFGKIAED